MILLHPISALLMTPVWTWLVFDFSLRLPVLNEHLNLIATGQDPKHLPDLGSCRNLVSS